MTEYSDKQKYVAEIDTVEMALLIAEACVGVDRPPGVTNEQCVAALPPGSFNAFMKAAASVVKYLEKKIAEAEVVQ